MGSDLTPRLDRDTALQWARDAVGRLHNIDSERLLAALLDRSFDFPRDLLETISSAQIYDPARVESCAAHRSARPLYLALAEHWQRIGEPAQARAVVERARTALVEARQPEATVAALDAFATGLSGTALPAEPGSRLTILWKRAATAGSQVVGLGILVAVIWGLYRGVQWIIAERQRALPVALLVAAAAAIYYLRHAIFQSLALFLRPTLVLSPGASGVHASRVDNAIRLVRPWFAGGELYAADLPMPGAEPYHQEGARLAPLTDRLGRMRRNLLGSRMPFELSVAPALQPVPWEALLHAGINGGRDLPESLQFFRTRQTPVIPAPGRWRDDDTVVLFARARDVPSLLRVWTAKASADRVTALDERAVSTAALTRPVRVLHLVGRTRRGSGERAFQLTSDHFLAASDLRPELAHIAIVQCRPQESLDRTNTDRELTASLRGFAADVFEAGAQTVVFVPVMPDAMSDLVIASLGGFCLRARRPSALQVLDQVSHLRRLIVESVAKQTAEGGAKNERLTEAAQRYRHSDAAGSETIDAAEAAAAAREMAFDITVWSRAPWTTTPPAPGA